MKSKKKTLNTNLKLFLLGRMVSDTGTSIQMMIMPLYIIDAGGTASTIGLFSFLALLPSLIIYPFAGVLGDRMNRKTIMVVTDFISGGAILVLAIISYGGIMRISVLLVVQVIISLLNGLFEPATRGMLPQLVDKDELTRINSTVSSSRGVAIMIGPVIGASLYANFDITMVFLVNGISFLLSGISEMMIRYSHIKRETPEGIGGIIRDLSEGIKFILGKKIIARLCFLYLLIYLIVQPIYNVLLPLFFKSSLKYSDSQYGYLQMIIILGALLGSILVGALFGDDAKLKSSLMRGSSLLPVTMLVYSILMFPRIIDTLGNNTVIYLVSLASGLCLLSAANIFVTVPIQTYIQKVTPNEYMSRVFSLVSLISRGGILLGILVYGFILEKLAMHWTVLAATILMMLISIVFVVSLLKDRSI